MDPQTKSTLTSILLALTTSAATAAAGVGIITKDQESQFASIGVSAIMWLIAWLIGLYKNRQHTPAAQIAAVNDAANGVKVVADTTIAPTITTPLKGPGA